MVNAIGTSLAALQNITKRVGADATSIANNQSTRTEDGSIVPQNDPTSDLIDLSVASNEFEANLKVIQTQDKMTKSLLDIIV
jgi:flagellar basal body rod protein FlgC